MSSTTRGHNLKLELTESQKNDLKEAFDLLAVGGTDEIEIKELKVAFRALGYEPDKDYLKRIMQERDKNGTGKMDFASFLEVFAAKMREPPTEEEIFKAYKNFAPQNPAAGITLHNLAVMANEMGEAMTEEELREMIAEADEDGDGVVGPHDILRILTENAGATHGRGAGGRSDK